MGEYADMMIEGLMCSGCGAFFVAEHGFPVLCKDCHQKKSKLPLATEKEIGENEGGG